MYITLRSFATIRDIINADSLNLEIPGGTSAGSLIDLLEEKHPELSSHRDSLLIAVNSEYCNKEKILKDGDTIALFPPVSGG